MTEEESAPGSGQGAWTVSEGGDEKRPVLIRVRTDLDAAVSGAPWPNRLAVVWSYALEGAEGQGGLPTSAQQAAMARLEDALMAGLETQGVAVLTSVATSSGQREWIWYCGPASALNPAFNAALKGHPRYPIKLHLAPDPRWAEYRRLCAAINSGAG
jgi:hypothetical protein